jgi:hypothetical protein
MKATILSWAAAAALVGASPVPVVSDNSTTTGAKTLPGVFYVAGEAVNLKSPVAVKSPCSVDDDVYTCAQKTTANWKVQPNMLSATNFMSLPGQVCNVHSSYDNGEVPCTLQFNYILQLSQCKLSNPTITDHQGVFDCNDSGGESK